MAFVFVLKSGECISIGKDTPSSKELIFYYVTSGCLKKLEAYGLSSDILKNTIQNAYDDFLKYTNLKHLDSSKIRQLKMAINEFVNTFNEDNSRVFENGFKSILNVIEPEVKRQYIIAKVNETRERNIPDPPVDISNDPVE
jgi:hypothetical protein